MHDIRPGHLDRCQICGSEALELVIDLGHQPLCDSLLSAEQLNGPEVAYPLRLIRCTDCSLAQLDYVVSGETVFHPDYPYRGGITKTVADHQQSVSTELVTELGLKADSLVVDVGSNDGTLLAAFKRHGVRVFGV